MLSQGYVLNSYEIHSVIGQGGFGIVYKGEHRNLGIEVAIKEYFPSDISVRRDGTIHPSKPEYQIPFEEGLERFFKEAKQLEKFRDCPGIVTCRDLFWANGTAYTIMEYVQGLSLSSLLKQRESRGEPLTETELLNLILPLLTGLQTVHDAGVCHRDIKPSNILIRRNGSMPVLIDFGAAKQEVSMQTKSFAPYTDGYAAIEQVGEGEIGPWTDVYGLGAVMWRVVAGGNPPFSPPNPPNIQKRAFELMHDRADPLPSARQVGKNRFSKKTLQAIDDCLIVHVNERIQSCNQLIERLRLQSAAAENKTDPRVVKEKKKKRPRTHKFWLSLVAVVSGFLAMKLMFFSMCGIGYLILGVGDGGAFQPVSWKFSTSWVILVILYGVVAAWSGGKTCARVAHNRTAPKYLIGLILILGIFFAMIAGLRDVSTFRISTPSFWEAMVQGVYPTWSIWLSVVLDPLGAAIGSRLLYGAGGNSKLT